MAGFYWLGVLGAKERGRRLLRSAARPRVHPQAGPDRARLRGAHYFTLLVFEGQADRYLPSDPLGKWDIFGTADTQVDYTPDRRELVVLPGGVRRGRPRGRADLAHDRALALYEDNKQAVRSQYWMLGVMVGFTSLALWLLSQRTHDFQIAHAGHWITSSRTSCP